MVQYCCECKNVYRCTRMIGDGVPVHCRHPDGRLIVAVFREWLPGDTFQDPQGEPYKGITNFIQTPMTNPVRPVKTADELLKEKITRTERTLIDSE